MANTEGREPGVVPGGAKEEEVGHKDYNKTRDAYQNRDIEASKREHQKKLSHSESHIHGAADYVKSVVFGGLDGIITTFAVIAAAAGADADYRTVLVFGFANVLADAFSMGFGEFVSASAERDHAQTERSREEWEVEKWPEMEVQEMEEIYQQKGLSEEDAKTLVAILAKDPKIFVDFMMVNELAIFCDLDDVYGPVKHGVVMFVAFILFGSVPLLTYLSGKGQGTDYIFGISCALTGVALLILGAVKGILTSMSIVKASLLMLFNGTISGGVSFGVGVLVEHIVGT